MFRLSGIIQICRNILCVSQYALLTHSFNNGHDFVLRQSEDICQIIDTRFCHIILGFGNVLLGNQGLYDTNCLFNILLFKQHRFRYTPACLIYVLDSDTSSKYLWHIIATLQITGLFQSGQRGTDTSFNIRYRVVPTSFACNFQCRTASARTLFCHIFHSLPNLLNFTDTQLRLV